MTHTAGLDADAHLSRTGIGEFAFDHLELAAGGGHLYGTTFH